MNECVKLEPRYLLSITTPEGRTYKELYKTSDRVKAVAAREPKRNVVTIRQA